MVRASRPICPSSGSSHHSFRFRDRGPLPALNPWVPAASVTLARQVPAAPIELGPEWFGLDVFDIRGWERLLVRAWRELVGDPDSSATTYAGPLGDARLRAALADHLSVRRGVRCDADAVAVTAGSMATFSAIARMWLGPDRVCVVEDPAGAQIRRALGGPVAGSCRCRSTSTGSGSTSCRAGPTSCSSRRAGNTRLAEA